MVDPLQVGAAVLKITVNSDNVQTSNFGDNAFEIINTGDKKIAQVVIDVTNALYPDSVFDPEGLAGDNVAKPLTINAAGDTGVVAPSAASYIGAGGTAGYRGLQLTFDEGVDGGFEPGETIGFSVDMDPNSVAGSLKDPLDAGSNPPWDVGGVSGAELIGSTFTVTFTDNSTATGQLQGTDNQAGAQALASQGSPNLAVTLTVNGLSAGGVGTYNPGGPSVIINGPPGETVRVVLTKGFIQPVTPYAQFLADQLAVLAAADFPANNAVEFQTVDVLLAGGNQDISGLFDFAGVPIYVFSGEDQLPIGFVASVIDPANQDLSLGPVTAPIYLQFEENPPSNNSDNGGIFWLNNITQQTLLWQMDGGTIVSTEDTSQLSEPGWNPHVGDLSGDGNDDIFWFNEITQQTSWWEINGGEVVTAEFISQLPEPGWNPHVGDLNGDGKSDVFWFNDITQQTSWWQMNGGEVVTAEFISQLPEPGWNPHVGDLNGDGNDDIFWFNEITQQTSWWQMNGGEVVTAEFISQLPEPGWNPHVGDLNGDGNDDIFWFNEITQQTSWWQMNGGEVVTAEFISQIPESGWNPHVGDLNADGNDDIFWLNGSTQQTSWWQMNGGTIVTAEYISQLSEPGWNPHIGDFNFG